MNQRAKGGGVRLAAIPHCTGPAGSQRKVSIEGEPLTLGQPLSVT